MEIPWEIEKSSFFFLFQLKLHTISLYGFFSLFKMQKKWFKLDNLISCNWRIKRESFVKVNGLSVSGKWMDFRQFADIIRILHFSKTQNIKTTPRRNEKCIVRRNVFMSLIWRTFDFLMPAMMLFCIRRHLQLVEPRFFIYFSWILSLIH